MAVSFVDTNVLIYAHDATAGKKHQRAVELMQELWSSGEGCLSVQVLQEFYVAITQKVAAPMKPARAARLVQDLSVWKVYSPVPDDVLQAIEHQQRHQLSFWDAMILQSAIQLGCEMLWTEDLNAGQLIEGVRIRNPFTTEQQGN